MIRIGNQTAFSALTPLEPFDYAVQNGFTAFEWFPDKKETGEGWVKEDVDSQTRDAIKETAETHDLALSLHTPWWANPIEPEGCEALLDHVNFANDIGAGILNFHLYIDKGIESFVQAIRPVIEAAARGNTKVSIENTPLTSPDDFNRLFERLWGLNDIPENTVGMCFDLGHANLCDATRNDYIRFMDSLSSQIPLIHVHLHENYGDFDSHLTVFTGPSAHNDAGIREFIKRLGKRDYSGSIILEQWPQPHTLLNQARDRLVHLIEKNNKKHRSDKRHDKKRSSERTLKEQRKSKEEAKYKKALQAYDRQEMEIPVVKKTEKKQPNTEGLEGFVKRVVNMEAETRSWREKLGWVASYVSNETTDKESLLYLAIYLRFLGTGEIVCIEDGRHFRPNRHAEFSRQIQEKLDEIKSSENAFILRKIYPWLPSFDSAYTRQEPLTRIRDIAHRNDIPKELKSEIKHTLQNKLHRCAGPEDLATSADILKRITAPGANYSHDFVEQFKIFHEELKEFFNATSLEQRLQTISDECGGISHWINEFIELKRKNLSSSEHLLELLRSLTQLRLKILQRVDQVTGSVLHTMRLAEIGLEDFAFVALSQLIQRFEGPQPNWTDALDTLGLTLENLIITGIEPQECKAIIAELKEISSGFDAKDLSQLLQLKATLDRANRLANVYSDQVLALFPASVEKLGRALGVENHVIQTYTEGDIRGNLVFQLSKIITLLQKAIRHEAELPPWDILVPGTAEGRLVLADLIYDISDTEHEQLIVLLKKAEGDEEIPSGVAGIVLAHEIPHLSHLGVRARQKGVVFVVCEDTEQFHKLTRHVNEFTVLKANAEGVSAEYSKTPTISKKVSSKKAVKVPEVNLNFTTPLIPLEEVVLETGGAKANEARRLTEMASNEKAEFRTPPGVVIPYGVMEKAFDSVPDIKEAYTRLTAEMNSLQLSDYDRVTEQLRQLVLKLPVPEDVVEGVKRHFSDDSRLMFRSSANCEDMEDMAGAGLYESVANAAPDNAADAVRQVWASIWTKRAALARKQAGIPHEKAHMAVLIQEMIIPDYSFIMHTLNPINLNKDELYIELAVGMGETLASGAVAGIPYRMICHKRNGSVKMLAFASFSHALQPDKDGGLVSKRVDYTHVPLSMDEAFRQQTGRHLARAGQFVEAQYDYPQDIEGVIVKDTVYLVQSRPQQGDFNHA